MLRSGFSAAISLSIRDLEHIIAQYRLTEMENFSPREVREFFNTIGAKLTCQQTGTGFPFPQAYIKSTAGSVAATGRG
ncbi:hypothetical protein, partial [Azospirillum sp. TSO22-1]|uniref:hypothetical protein n=1 Tax=Azospirillum sp. TSO22-1 TaxID=716789 RepID=UPI001B3BDFF0